MQTCVGPRNCVLGGSPDPNGKGLTGGNVLDIFWTVDESSFRPHRTQPIARSRSSRPGDEAYHYCSNLLHFENAKNHHAAESQLMRSSFRCQPRNTHANFFLVRVRQKSTDFKKYFTDILPRNYAACTGHKNFPHHIKSVLARTFFCGSQCTHCCWRRGVVVSGVRRMNEVNARRARLVLLSR